MSTAPLTFASLSCAGALAVSLACAGLASAGDAPASAQLIYRNKLVTPLSLSSDIKASTVAKVKFFVTADNGKTWKLAQESALAPGSSENPHFPFTVDHDGSYGIMTCVTYRDGRVESDPSPGRQPLYVLVIDTTPPVISHFDPQVIATTAGRAVVRCTWAVTDANPAVDAVTIEASTDSGVTFSPLFHGPSNGTNDLTVQLTPGVKELQLRLSAVDHAGNAKTSGINVLALTLPAAATAPEVAVAPLTTAGPTAPTTTTSGAPTVPVPPVAGVHPAGTVSKVEQTLGASGPTPPAPGSDAPAKQPPAATDGTGTSDLAQAAKILPTLNDIGAAPLPVLPEIPQVAQDQSRSKAKPTLVAVDPRQSPSAPDARVAVQGATLLPQSGTRPDIVIDPPKDSALGADAPPLTGTDEVDHDVYRKILSQSNLNRGHGMDPIDNAAADEPHAARASQNPKGPDGQRIAPNLTHYLSDAEATDTLTQARIADNAGHLSEACDLYERLLGSSQARTGAILEAQLLVHVNHPKDVLTLINALPSELLTDDVRLEDGRALALTGQIAEAITALERIGRRSPQARPALAMLATCHERLGHAAKAHAILVYLSKGDDDIAAGAVRQLGRTGH